MHVISEIWIPNQFTQTTQTTSFPYKYVTNLLDLECVCYGINCSKFCESVEKNFPRKLQENPSTCQTERMKI